MRNILFTLFFSLVLVSLQAQEGGEVFTFLRYPSSARANALGGHTVSLVETDPSLIFHNPALLGAEMDQMVNLNYMNYIADINVGSALYTKAIRERSAWGIGANFISYGEFTETSPDNSVLGTFSAKDVCMNGFFSYDLSDTWRGGVSLKFLYSSLEKYTSIGLGVDVGLSYYNTAKGFSAGFVLKNMGAQLKAYDEQRQKMPWDIQVGLSKKMAHAPFRFSVTAMYLNKWKLSYIDNNDETVASGDGFVKSLSKHLVFGVDFIPTNNFWVGVGFNPKANADMKLQNGNKMGGFSAGAGVKVKRFDVGVSIARYHPSASSLMLSVSTVLGNIVP